MHQVLSYAVHYLSTNWSSIGTYLLAGGGVSLFVKFIDKFRKWEKSGIKEAAVAVVSGLTALTNWIINNYATSPLASLGNVGARLYVAAVFMHRLLINPLSNTIEAKLFNGASSFATMRQEAATYRAEVNAQKAAPEKDPLV